MVRFLITYFLNRSADKHTDKQAENTVKTFLGEGVAAP